MRRMVMNTRFQNKQRILPKLAFYFATVLLLSSVTSAQQISPNPNPDGNTIFVNDPNTNDVYFDNQGTIQIETTGELNNSYIFDNEATGMINNYGYFLTTHSLNNYGTVTNIGSGDPCSITGGILQMRGGTVNNNGDIINEDWGVMHIHGDTVLNNYGNINNELGGIVMGITLGSDPAVPTGTINNYGTIDNKAGSIINNHDDGTINNYGTFTNYADSTVSNDGTFDNTLGTFINNGTYQGTGTFISTLDTGPGTVAPGNSAGMTIRGR